DDDIDFVQAVANVLANAIEQDHIETQLRETREWYQRIIDHLSDHVIIVDESGEITYCSPPVERQMGYTPEEVIGTNAFEYVHPDDQETAAAAFAETLENPDKHVRVEYRSPAKDGTYRWIEARGANHLDDPVIEGVMVSVREITERKEYEQELQRYEQIIETIDDIAFVVGDDWTVEYVSPAIQEYVDASLDELEGRSVMALAETYVADDDDPARFEAALTRAFESTTESAGEGRPDSPERLELALDIDGDRVVFEYQFSPMGDDDNPVGVAITMRDITHRKEREQRLQKTTARLEALFENSPDMIDVLDPEGTLLDVNQRFCEELGYEEEDVLGRPIWEIDQLVDEDEVRRLLADFDLGDRQ
ncbi:MAG: PAS domain S-box protein, partial [Halobacteriaceae archaeon]